MIKYYYSHLTWINLFTKFVFCRYQKWGTHSIGLTKSRACFIVSTAGSRTQHRKSYSPFASRTFRRLNTAALSYHRTVLLIRHHKKSSNIIAWKPEWNHEKRRALQRANIRLTPRITSADIGNMLYQCFVCFRILRVFIYLINYEIECPFVVGRIHVSSCLLLNL